MSQPEAADALPKLEKYELCEEIGHGGMATVYRAIDPRLGREVAVKIIHRHLRDNGEVGTRFVAEARAAAKLKHKGIVEVYDVSREEDRERYLVAELIRGVTLRKVLLDHREMPAEVGAAIVAELCDAVEHAHEAGIVHRDIKPENVLVERPSDRGPTSGGSRSTPAPRAVEETEPSDDDDDDDDDDESSAPRAVDRKRAVEAVASANDTEPANSDRPSGGRSKLAPRSSKADGRVIIKLTDFGIAKVLDAQGVTSTGQVLGSPAHMAPEQIEGGEVDVRTDVFALGVLLYECMVGHLPFEGKNPAQVLRRVIEGNFSPAEVERASVGGRFGEIVAHALATSAEDRTESPAALRADLLKELGELGLGEPQAEIAAYFAEPEKYREELPKRLVPKLVARGEAFRKQRKIPLAAGDFNRAHALAPGDSTILKKITQLSSARGRERMIKRVAALTGGAVALAAITFGVVKVSRLYSARLSPDPAPSLAANGNDRPVHPDVDRPDRIDPVFPRPSTVPSLRPSARIPGVVRTVGTGPDVAPPSGAPRKVLITVSPQDAIATVDGQPVGTFGETLTLPPGKHSYTVTPPKGSACCEANESSFEVPAPDKNKPDAVHSAVIHARFKQATVSFQGVGSVSCPWGTISAGGSLKVSMSQIETMSTCRFTHEDKSVASSVTIKAGGDFTLAWPN